MPKDTVACVCVPACSLFRCCRPRHPLKLLDRPLRYFFCYLQVVASLALAVRLDMLFDVEGACMQCKGHCVRLTSELCDAVVGAF